ncbi:tagatose-1,6-bisphosphate aldolase [Lacticaseibacillus pantheris DSM 15945 = JCM 12539 = NBRC 106106]|uniref:Tagatose-1,6-bisphosphate aldolase n=1 Tax=Lacticaseibacillus pantheris DSM 15945 = JCM 12539 = NBRC 106106 TaxID=1423783 RepID=A0A0R1U498_9LACO|nr:class II fructose-bisphosphate aldolase [Lacticaseibacillus pantheris]KRL88080.1 tagatose-1,6-bisphosphate aldolase [Lacticaseibacillus pantheris DSM 15945 = JCM 12539 = NBRC 106106]
MTLVNLNEILKSAQAGHYAVGAFNVTNLEMVDSIVNAAESQHAPVVVQYAEGDDERITIEKVGYYATEIARQASVPVVVHLDHGHSFSACMRAIRCGYSSVMFDGSELPYDENLETSKEVVKVAHEVGVSVEVELGRMIRSNGRPLTNPDITELMTNPDIAGEFSKKTNADALAVSFGTVHGVYKTVPKLNFDRLKALRENIKQPLVVHGGSGLKTEEYQQMAQMGITKINFYSDMANRVARHIVSDLVQKGEDIYIQDWTDLQLKYVTDDLAQKIRVFGSANMANIS